MPFPSKDWHSWVRQPLHVDFTRAKSHTAQVDFNSPPKPLELAGTPPSTSGAQLPLGGRHRSARAASPEPFGFGLQVAEAAAEAGGPSFSFKREWEAPAA